MQLKFLRGTAPLLALSATIFVGLTGCQLVGIDIQGVEDAVSALTDPMVAQAIVLGVEDPDSPALAPLVTLGVIQPGVTVNIYVANAANSADITKAPVNGANVVVETTDEAYSAPRVSEGSYALDPKKDVAYEDDHIWTLWVDTGREKASWIDVLLPKVADVDLPNRHDEGDDLTLDFSSQGFHSSIVVVYNDRGLLTWGNTPKSIAEVYNRSLATESLGEVVVPGAAFPEPGLYMIGYAGIVHNDDEQIGELNKLLSRGMSGKFNFDTITVK